MTHTFLWRKLDGVGLDSCRLTKVGNGWRLGGAAVFVDQRRVCHLQYEVITNRVFVTKCAEVIGYCGKKPIDIRCETRGGAWRINGTVDRRLVGCIDVDFGFTPATNLLAVRRLALRIGQSGEARAVFLNLPAGRFSALMQRYERIAATSYAYQAPAFRYAAILRISSVGAVLHYPGLFQLISQS